MAQYKGMEEICKNGRNFTLIEVNIDIILLGDTFLNIYET